MVRFLYEKYTEHAGFGFLPEDYNGCIYQYFYEHIHQDIKGTLGFGRTHLLS